MIFAGQFLTTIFEIDVDGRRTRVIPRDYQLDPVKDFPLHVDFLRLAEGQTIKVTVPVHVVGQDESPGLKRGGTLQVVEHAIELLVPTDAIPAAVDVSIAALDIGGTVHLADVALPEGAKAVGPDDMTLVTVVAPTGIKEEAAAAATTAEPAEAEPAKA
jgi:large subunit ribosomal protein L25